jgi:tRNA pseudouridine65 synthase
LFALDSDMNSKLQQQFLRYECGKTYLALVRGFTDDQGTIDYPLKTDRGNLQDALSHYTTVQRFEVPIALGKFKTSRYSLVEVKPKTGRTHQIRRHFAHISHPIIGDRRHGCNRQNNLFRDHDSLQLDTMLLHASSLKFTHPVSQEDVTLEAELRTPFRAIVTALADMSLSNEEINMKIAHELELRRESTIALTNNKHNSNSTANCEGNSNDNCGAESSEDCLLKRQKVHDTEYQSSHHT